jgi:hypothetical protein
MRNDGLAPRVRASSANCQAGAAERETRQVDARQDKCIDGCARWRLDLFCSSRILVGNDEKGEIQTPLQIKQTAVLISLSGANTNTHTQSSNLKSEVQNVSRLFTKPREKKRRASGESISNK